MNKMKSDEKLHKNNEKKSVEISGSSRNHQELNLWHDPKARELC